MPSMMGNCSSAVIHCCFHEGDAFRIGRIAMANSLQMSADLIICSSTRDGVAVRLLATIIGLGGDRVPGSPGRSCSSCRCAGLVRASGTGAVPAVRVARPCRRINGVISWALKPGVSALAMFLAITVCRSVR